jgi:hypothetical protein
MAVTMAQVRALLDVDEPDYLEAAALGPDAIPHLKTLVREADAMLASKAAYLAGLIATDAALDVVKAAAESSEPVVRVAAAAAVRNLSPAAGTRVLNPLLTDPDPGVRKAASKARRPGTKVEPEGGAAPPDSGGGSITGEAVPYETMPRGAGAGGEGGGLDQPATPSAMSGEGGGSPDTIGAGRSFVAGEGGGSLAKP